MDDAAVDGGVTSLADSRAPTTAPSSNLPGIVAPLAIYWLHPQHI